MQFVRKLINLEQEMASRVTRAIAIRFEYKTVYIMWSYVSKQLLFVFERGGNIDHPQVPDDNKIVSFNSCTCNVVNSNKTEFIYTTFNSR